MSRELYFFLALLATAGVTYIIRAVPLVFVRRRIESRFIRSFLYYVPYVVLTALAFPAILHCTDNLIACAAATVICALLAYCGRSLITCVISAMATVLIVQWITMLM